MKHVLYFIVIAAAMLALSRIIPGFVVTGWVPAILAAIVLAIVNTIVRPVLWVLTLPLTIITLGLFLFVINALCLWLTAVLVPGFTITGFWAALIASLLLACVSLLWKALTSKA